MKGVLPVAAQWVRAGREFAMATVVEIVGSAPRELGASMLVRADGTVLGNVSGGCVEAAVIEECLEVLGAAGHRGDRDADDGVSARVVTYGISDGDGDGADALFGAGLTCGGTIRVLVRAIRPDSDAAAQVCALDAAETVEASARPPIALALVTAGPGLGDAYLVGAGGERSARTAVPAARAAALADAAALGGDDRAALLHYDLEGCRTLAAPAMSLLVVPFGAPPLLIVVGAVEFAVPLTRLGAALGYRVTVVDPRPAFASAARFPGAEVVVDWPDRYLERTPMDARTAICVLSHDAKIDVPALVVALAGPAGYVGAMGSRRTHDDRIVRLSEAGVSRESIATLRSPIGLDLGGRSPAETALSILAEIVAVRHGASGGPLSRRDGPVHARADAPVSRMPLVACDTAVR